MLSYTASLVRAKSLISMFLEQNAPGRISFTCDMWTSMILRSFLAVTLHYCTEDGTTHEVDVRSRLGAFRHVLGSHSGKNLAIHFITVLKELGILHRVCSYSS